MSLGMAVYVIPALGRKIRSSRLASATKGGLWDVHLKQNHHHHHQNRVVWCGVSTVDSCLFCGGCHCSQGSRHSTHDFLEPQVVVTVLAVSQQVWPGISAAWPRSTEAGEWRLLPFYFWLFPQPTSPACPVTGKIPNAHVSGTQWTYVLSTVVIKKPDSWRIVLSFPENALLLSGM